jgi:hypothetical protein
MLVHWKESRVWTVAWKGPHDDVQMGKHYASKQTILPGVQEIDDEVWEKMKQVPDVQARIEAGRLVEVKTGAKNAKDETEHGLPKSLAKFSVPDATELVSGVMDVDVLKAWSKSEKRTTVKDAIRDQLKALEPGEDENKG